MATRSVSFADGLSPGSPIDDFSLTESLASPLLYRSAHTPKPPPKGKRSLSKLQQVEQTPKTDVATTPKPSGVQYLQNRKTSLSERSFVLRSDRTFPLDVEPTSGSSFVVGQAEIIRRKARENAKLSSFATPSKKPLLKCRTVRLPSNEKMGPSVHSVPQSDDTWLLSPHSEQQVQHRLTRDIRPIAFVRGSENTSLNFPTEMKDVRTYPDGPKSSTILDDEKWRSTLGLEKLLPGNIDQTSDIREPYKLSLKGPMKLAIKQTDKAEKKELLNQELFEQIQAEKERKEVLSEIKRNNKKLVESGLPIPNNSTMIVNKHNKAKIARDEKIERMRKEINQDIKGKRWRGELSSFQSQVERLASLTSPIDRSYHDVDNGTEASFSTSSNQIEKGRFGLLRSDFDCNQPKPSSTFASTTGRVPIFGDTGGSITVSRSLPQSEKWEPNGSIEVRKLHLSDSNAIIESVQQIAAEQEKAAAAAAASKKGSDKKGNDKKGNEAFAGSIAGSMDGSLGISSLLSALSFDDDEGDLDIDEMVALRAEKRSAIQARVVAEEAAKMPTVLSDWLVRYKVESLKPSLASEFGITTMNDIIEVNDQEMDSILYSVPKGMRDRFNAMVQEIKHKDDLSFALSEATGSASFGVEARRSSVRPSLKTLCKRISQSKSFESMKLTKKLSEISGVSSSIKSAGSSSVISSESQETKGEDEDSDSSDDGLELLYGNSSDFIRKASFLDDKVGDDKEGDVESIGSGGVNKGSSVSSPLTAASLNKLKRRTSSLSLKSKDFDTDTRRSSLLHQQQQSALYPPIPVDAQGRKGPASLPIQPILQNQTPASSLNTFSKRHQFNQRTNNDNNNNSTSSSISSENVSLSTFTSLSSTEKKKLPRSLRKRVGVGGDQLGQIRSMSVISTLKKEISEESKARLLNNSTPLVLSHMNKAMQDSKNNYLKKGLVSSFTLDDDAEEGISIQRDQVTSNFNSSLETNGGAVASFRLGGDRLEPSPKDRRLIANLEYDYDNLKSVVIKSPEKVSAAFAARPRPSLFEAHTGNDFNFGAVMPSTEIDFFA